MSSEAIPMSSAAAQHRVGLALVATAAFFWSTGGIFVRLISTDLMTMLFLRGLFSGSAVFIVYFLLEGKAGLFRLRHLRAPAFAVAALSAMSMISGIGSIRYTTVAEALIIYATVPFMTAALAFIVLREVPSRRTFIAGLVAFAGVAFMLKDASWDGSLFGKGLAVFMTLGMAGMTTIMRRNKDVPMLPAMALSAWLCSSITFWFAVTSVGQRTRPSPLCALRCRPECDRARPVCNLVAQDPGSRSNADRRPRSAAHAALGLAFPGRGPIPDGADRWCCGDARALRAYPHRNTTKTGFAAASVILTEADAPMHNAVGATKENADGR